MRCFSDTSARGRAFAVALCALVLSPAHGGCKSSTDAATTTAPPHGGAAGAATTTSSSQGGAGTTASSPQGGAGGGGTTTSSPQGGAGGAGLVCPGSRYEVTDPGSAACTVKDGSGLVLDHTTKLVWARKVAAGQTQAQAEAYCQTQGARLPTRDEARGIAGDNYDACAFPCDWETWTSTPAAAGEAWVVHRHGYSYNDGVDSSNTVLCVR